MASTITAFLRRRAKVVGFFLHAGLVACSLAAAFFIRFELTLPESEWKHLLKAGCVALVVKMLCFHFGRLERRGWRYVSILDLKKIFEINAVASVAFTIASFLVVGVNVPRSVYCIDFLLCFLLTAGIRFAFRLHCEQNTRARSSGGKRKAILIYGAGSAGVTLLKEIRSNPALGYSVRGFLDDAPGKHGRLVLDTPVLGMGRDAAKIIGRQRRRNVAIEEILIAMPSARGHQMQDAVANCRSAGVAFKTVPGMSELLSGRVALRQVRNVQLTDLLGRNPVHLEEKMIEKFLKGRSVMVTGAGGSIGSELCRQVLRFQPSHLVAFEQGETELFNIQMEVNRRFPSSNFHAEIGDIRDRVRVNEVIQHYGVECIFHAAAYKHVPMMERHVVEAVKNNVLGTRNVVEAAYRNGVSDFVMISSDKAVNPTNVMGLTKRVAELLVSSMPTPAHGGGTKFVSVRFGNVLGSNGSVVPLFTQQIESGGPVTVTHPAMTRYFMTIGEAVQLVLQASTIGRGAEIFVLDMGEPVRIVDLAESMVRLAGREPYTEIEIRFTGLRPGEKLHEELMLQGEDIVSTAHEKIKIFQGPMPERENIERSIYDLESLVKNRDEFGIVTCLHELVPEYQPGGAWRKAASVTRRVAAAGA